MTDVESGGVTPHRQFGITRRFDRNVANSQCGRTLAKGPRTRPKRSLLQLLATSEAFHC